MHYQKWPKKCGCVDFGKKNNKNAHIEDWSKNDGMMYVMEWDSHMKHIKKLDNKDFWKWLRLSYQNFN